MRTVIVNYGSGNLHSAEKSFRRVADENSLGEVALAACPDIVAKADRIVLPGVGAFASCLNGLQDRGLPEALSEAVVSRGVPFLGICVGMQLMATTGLEHGTTRGFGWLPGRVEAIGNGSPKRKLPHMGWNDLGFPKPHPLFAGIAPGTDVYFVHSYHFRLENEDQCIASAEHGCPIAAAVASDNMAGVQFHPEKSQSAGLSIIRNFLAWKP